MDFRRETDAASFLPHVNQHAVAFLGDLPQRRVQLISTIAPARSEHVAGETFAMNAHQRRFVLLDLAFHQREMMHPVERRAVHMQIEIAVISRQFYHLFELDQLFALSSIGDQTLDRANAQPVLFAELHQLRQPRHRSVVMQDFAEHAGRLQPGHPRKIDRRFGVTGPS